MKPAHEAPSSQAPAATGNAIAGGAPSWTAPQWWPSLAVVALAGFVAFDMTKGSQAASILAASGLVYLGAAALQKPAAAWWVFLATFVVITASSLGAIPFDATWILLGLAAVFVVYGLLRRSLSPVNALPLQTVAMIIVGAIAAIAVVVNGLIGAYLVAGGLLAHAAWDLYHHWSKRVVVRSLAEFCFVLDAVLAAAIVFVALRSSALSRARS